MASKPVPAKKKLSATKPTTTTEESQDLPITIIKEASCKNLQGTATLVYRIGRDDKGELHWKIHSNTGAGMFSNRSIQFTAIQKVLTAWPKDSPITSITLSSLCTGSINTRSFLLATLVNEGILQQVPDKKRHYQLGDPAAFPASLDKLKSQHSEASTGKPKAKAKAGARMQKGKAKPATGK